MSRTNTSSSIALLFAGAAVAFFLFLLGPLGWLLGGALGFVAIVETLLRDGSDGSAESDGSAGSERPQFCANCGAELDLELAETGDGKFGVNYCNACGAPVPSGGESGEATERINCPGCGSLVQKDQSECGYCGETLPS
jgi:DNA-directed RNA polymerase subunit RPC12/RpoP